MLFVFEYNQSTIEPWFEAINNLEFSDDFEAGLPPDHVTPDLCLGYIQGLLKLAVVSRQLINQFPRIDDETTLREFISAVLPRDVVVQLFSQIPDDASFGVLLHGASHKYYGPNLGAIDALHRVAIMKYMTLGLYRGFWSAPCGSSYSLISGLDSEDYAAEIYSNRHEHGLEKYQLHECFNKAVSVSYYSPFCISTLTPKWLKANTFALSTHFVRKNESADTNRLTER